MIGGFKKADSVSKDWKGSVRGDTSMDKLRKRFNEVHGTSTETGEKGTLLGAAQYTHNNKTKWICIKRLDKYEWKLSFKYKCI